MGETDRPKFSIHVEAEIEAAQINVDGHFWKLLQNMQIPGSLLDSIQRRLYSTGPSQPAHIRPKMLLATLVNYARSLFLTEANNYENSHIWLTGSRL